MEWAMTESLAAVLLKWEPGHLLFDSNLVEIIFVVVHSLMVILFSLLLTVAMVNERQDAFENIKSAHNLRIFLGVNLSDLSSVTDRYLDFGPF